MRNKKGKLIKLEKNRYSILTENLEQCFICKSPYVEIHEVFGGRNRKISMQNGFCVPLCHNHHQQATLDNEKSLFLKRKMQAKFEETHTREEFMRLIGKNYLE